MKRYWDMDDKARAGLSYEEVNELLVVELMERGVLRPRPPVPEPLTETALEQRVVFMVRLNGYQELDIAFPTASSAAAFIASGVLHVESDYDAGNIKYTEAFREPCVAAVPLATRESILPARLELRENHARRQRNDKARAEYEKAVAALETETRDIRDDWNRCCGLSMSHARVAETWESYCVTAGGDPRLAWRFLIKTFAESAVRDAFEWLGIEAPKGDGPEPCDVVAAASFDGGAA